MEMKMSTQKLTSRTQNKRKSESTSPHKTRCSISLNTTPQNSILMAAKIPALVLLGYNLYNCQSEEQNYSSITSKEIMHTVKNEYSKSNSI